MSKTINEDTSGVENLGLLLENNLEKAEIVLASQDITAKLQDMAEDLAKMVAHDIFPLVDTMKTVFGPDIAERFEQGTKDAIEKATDSVRHAKDTILDYANKLEEGGPFNDMADDDGSEEEFGGEKKADDSIIPSGGDTEESDEVLPLGRSMKESFISADKAIFEDEQYISYGRSLLETHSLGHIKALLLKEAAKSRADAVEILKKFNELSAKNPEGLAGWIGSKILAPSVFAQTDTPVVTASQSVSAPVAMALSEGKSFKRNKNYDNDDEIEKAMRFMKRSLERKFKGNVRDSELIEYAKEGGHNKIAAIVVMDAKRNAKDIAGEVARELDRENGEFDPSFIAKRVKAIVSYAIAEATAHNVNSSEEFTELLDNLDENYISEIIETAITQLIVSVENNTNEVKAATKKINNNSLAGEILSSFRATYEDVFKVFGTEKKEEVVAEKRGFDDEDDDYNDRRRAKARDLARKQARKSKNLRQDDLDEGRKFDDDDDYEDRKRAKKRDLERKNARRGKYSSLEEKESPEGEVVFCKDNLFVIRNNDKAKPGYDLVKKDEKGEILLGTFAQGQEDILKTAFKKELGGDLTESELFEKFKFDDEDDDYSDRKRAKKRDLERKNARERKQGSFDLNEENIDEGFKNSKIVYEVGEYFVVKVDEEGKKEYFELLKDEEDKSVLIKKFKTADAAIEKADKLASKANESIVAEKGRFDDEDYDDDYASRKREKARALARKHARKSKNAQYDESNNLVAEEKVDETLSNSDKRFAAGAMTKIASKIASDRGALRKPVTSVVKDMDPKERSAVNKIVNQMRKNGKPPKNIGDLVSGAGDQIK